MLKVTAHHMSFPVKDLAAAREFYEGVLGLEAIPRPDFPFPGAWYQAGAVQVHLIETMEGMEIATPPRAINPIDRHDAFGIEDYDATLKFLESKGIETFGLGEDIGQMFIQDPDGNIIELICDDTLTRRLDEQEAAVSSNKPAAA